MSKFDEQIFLPACQRLEDIKKLRTTCERLCNEFPELIIFESDLKQKDHEVILIGVNEYNIKTLKPITATDKLMIRIYKDKISVKLIETYYSRIKYNDYLTKNELENMCGIINDLFDTVNCFTNKQFKNIDLFIKLYKEYNNCIKENNLINARLFLANAETEITLTKV